MATMGPMLRFILALPLLLISAASAEAQDETRVAWQVERAGSPQVFRSRGDGVWYETEDGKVKFRFREVRQNKQFVVLHDATRHLWLRLGSKKAEFAQAPLSDKPSWMPFAAGAWIAADKLPAIPAVPPIDHRIRVLYFVPHDRAPTKDYAAKIRTLLHYVNDIYRSDLRAKGYKFTGLPFETNKDGIVVHLVRGAHTADYYNNKPRYDETRQGQLIQAEFPDDVVTVHSHISITFAETYDHGPAKFEWDGGMAHASKTSDDGGVAFFSAWILQDDFCATTVAAQRALLFDSDPIRGRTAMGHGKRNSPRFEFIEDGFGAVAHELGHAFGLPHDEDPRSIMGGGMRDIRLNFDPRTADQRVGFFGPAARLLMCSRHLNPALNASDRTAPTCEASFAKPPIPGAKQVVLRVSAADDQALRAVMAHVVINDGQDGDYVAAGRELSGRQQVFLLSVPLSKPLPNGKLTVSLTAADEGGCTFSTRVEATVGK